MPHKPGHTYTIAVINEPYTGRVVQVGDNLFTTVSGTFEGGSQRLVQTSLDTNLDNISSESVVNQDTVTTFIVGDNTNFGRGTYYYGTGNLIPRNTQLHHHTIIPQGRTSNFMTQHTMDDNAIDVFTTIRTIPMGRGRVSSQTQAQTRRAQTSNSGMSGNQRSNLTGGGGSGGGGY